MNNNIVLLYSNDHKHSCKIARDVCSDLECEVYVVEDRAALMLNEEGPLKENILLKFGPNSYIDNKINVEIFKGLDFYKSPKIDNLQNLMNLHIINELNEKQHNVLVISTQLIETGLIHLTNNLITCKFYVEKEYDEYISIDSIREISSHYIEPNDFKIMSVALRGCLIECWRY